MSATTLYELVQAFGVGFAVCALTPNLHWWRQLVAAVSINLAVTAAIHFEQFTSKEN